MFAAAAMLMSTAAAHASTTWCAIGTSTTWIGGSGNWAAGGSGNWSNGLPTSSCTASISGNVTVTLTTTPDPDGYTDDGAAVKGITISNGATLIIEGASGNADGNWSNQTDLGVGPTGVTVGAGSTLELDASDTSVDPPVAPEKPGATAQLILTNTTAAPVVNNGTILTVDGDPANYKDVINFGGTLTNNGTINVQSGTLDFSGASPYMTATNPGTINVSSGATLAMQAGDGSSFTNTGHFTNNGTVWAGGTMHWVAGGTMAGNPVQLQYYSGAPTLVDSANAGGGTYLFDAAGGFLTGTIPAGQTVEAQGFTYNCSGNVCNDTSINLGNNTVINHGTLLLDAPGSGTTTGGISTLTYGTLDNYGTVESTVEDSNYHNEMQVALNNEPGGTVKVMSGTLYQEGGWAATNSGLWQVAPKAIYELYGGNFTNSRGGTLQPQISGKGAFGVINPRSGTFTAGGKLVPALTSGYKPSKGTDFQLFPLDGGTFTGRFGSTGAGFTSDYKHLTVTTGTPFVGAIYGGAAASGPKPAAKGVKGAAGAVKLTLSCAKGRACRKYSVTVSVTEHLKGTRVTAVTARAAEKKAPTTKVVKVATASGSVGAGKTKALTVKLNKAGAALLKRFGKLRVAVTVTAGGSKVSHATVTVTRTAKKK